MTPTLSMTLTRPIWRRACMLALLLPAAWPAAAAPARAVGEAGRYQREQARCMAMRVHGERANCLSEAHTAHTAALPPVVDVDPGRYARHALARCKMLPEADRPDCVTRMQGGGTTTGSVAGGGIYRELVTIERAAPPASAPGSAAPAASAAP